jgi:hypothetical protein
MAVAVQSNLMAGVGDHAALFWESLERVAGDEPCRLDVVLFEHLEQSSDTDGSGEEAWDADQFACHWECRLRGSKLRFSNWSYIPREMSLVLSSPPYEPSHPATASMSTEMQHWTSGWKVSSWDELMV